jgi:hypothetical protein
MMWDDDDCDDDNEKKYRKKIKRSWRRYSLLLLFTCPKSQSIDISVFNNLSSIKNVYSNSSVEAATVTYYKRETAEQYFNAYIYK